MTHVDPHQSLFLPQRQLGMVAPLLVTSEISYQFYRLQTEMGGPWNASLAEASMDLRGFTKEALADAQGRFDAAVEGLVHKGVEFVIQSGVPVMVLASFAYWRERLGALSERYSMPFVTDFETTLAAFRALGAGKIAIANKWTPDMNRQLISDIHEYSDIKVIGLGTDLQDATRVSGMRPEPGIESARLSLRRALEESDGTPDALFLAGGAWYSTLATAALEDEFGMPIVTNPGASMWYALNRVDCFAPAPSFGALYALELDE